MTSLVDKLVPEDLWAIVKPYCHHHTATLRRPTPHHPRPQCFAAIVFMTRISTPWRLLPARELGCGSPATA